MTSSAFFPPEIAQFELEKLSNDPPDPYVVACEQLEMWYFGLMLLQMSTKDSPTLWQSTQADSMLHSSDLQLLAYSWDTMKLDRLGMDFDQDWAAAMDLALWCLQGVSTRRPCSMEAVFKHKFFNSTDGELRFLQSTDEPWDEFVRRHAAALHAAIDRKDSNAVQELFSLGAAHMNMIDGSVVEGSTIRPLHRAAFAGDTVVVRILIDQIPDVWPDHEKTKILDCRTMLEYTPHMLACKCGHVEVANMLSKKGCNEKLENSSKKTGKKLLSAFQREVELSHLHPWNRGDQMHLAAKNAESFLDMVQVELNEHVRAGMQVWNSKQMVWKFSTDQMRALQAEIKQLVQSTHA